MKRALAKITMALAFGLLTIAVLDGFNPLMGFLTSTPSKVFIACACCAAAVLAAVCLADTGQK